MRNVRQDLDMLIRIATRVDHTADALRADIQTLSIGLSR
jgi:hypothetical protein